jgi:ribosome-associated protein
MAHDTPEALQNALQTSSPIALHNARERNMETAEDDLIVNRVLAIPRSELVVHASRSGGPGGQHVNTSSTRVEVLWNVRTSSVLFDDQRTTIMHALRTRLSAAGDLRVVASDTRSQRQNRALAEQRLAEIVRRALIVKKARKLTRPTRSAVERRLAEKKLQSRRKHDRRDKGED